MKKLYFLVVLVMSFATQAQIVNIPDANFKAKLLSASPSNQIASTEIPIYDNSTYSASVSSYVTIDTNSDGEIQISEAQAIKYLNINCGMYCYNVIYDMIGIESFTNLYYLNMGDDNQQNYLDLSNNTNLEFLFWGAYLNTPTTLNVSACVNLKHLYCGHKQLTTLDITNCTNLVYLDCSDNFLTTLDISNKINLKHLDCSYNQLSNLDVTNLTNLKNLILYNNQITTLNTSNLVNLQNLNLNSNQVSYLDTSNLTNILQLQCFNNNLTSLDLSNCQNIYLLSCDSNQLSYLNIKNGIVESSIYLSNNPNLNYICVDDSQISQVQNLINSAGYVNCQINSYCSFTPGGTFYSIEGINKWDFNNNGCDNLDFNYSNLKFNQTVSNNLVGVYVANQSGNYSIPVQAGTHTISPVLENPTYFNISPTSFVANFPTQASPLIQDCCVTANGVHHDVEVTIIPTNPARPGFDAIYTIIYKNKGNQVENGAVTLDFNDAVLDLVSANPSFSSQATNTLIWNYTNLLPLETRTIDLVFNVNSPTETPAVNIGDVLNYTVIITPFTTDEFVSDNTSTLSQTVVGSYDPNDKTCIEGTTVSPDMIGQYVHYVIRFENTGTYPAENIVVKDMIDLAKFDVNTLIPLHSSHDFVTRIAGNKVEFIFEGINLPFDDANNDGYVTFKIKTKSNLVVGDTFSNDANIYFDYNFPITTNTFETTITALKVTDFDFGTHFTLYPNPVKDVLNFQSKDNTAINSIEIYNTLGQVVLAVPNLISTVDVSNLQSGNYFVKVNTDLGVSNTKFIKE